VEYRRLGRTGLEVSAIGLGGIALSKVSPLVAKDMLERSLALGVNFFDTARGYREGEEKLGRTLGRQRPQVYIMSRSLHCSGNKLTEDLNGSLTALGSDYVDLYGIHNVQLEEDLQRILGPGGALEALSKARQAGKVRFVAISSHLPEILDRALRTGSFDVIGYPLNVLDRDGITGVFPLARQQDVGIVTVKPFGMGLFDARPATLRYVLNQDIDTTVPGARSVAEIEANVAVLADTEPVSEGEREQIIALAEQRKGRQFCRGCDDCPPCPRDVPVREILRLEDYYNRYHMFDWAWLKYRSVEPKASLCSGCSRCQVECPYLGDIKGSLETAHAELSPSLSGLRILRQRMRRSLTGREH
jgi:uncharacterized protein